MDLNILSKIIARRLEKIIPKIIDKDQNGFVQGRQGFHSVRRILNILFEEKGATDTPLLSLDAEKAFDTNNITSTGSGTPFISYVSRTDLSHMLETPGDM